MEIAPGQLVEVLANLGVIAGIIFLALELKQNNQLLRAQARRDQLDARAIALAAETKDTDLANLSFKLASGDPLTPFEQYRFEAWAFHLFIQWEWQYGEYRAGTLAADKVSVGGWRSRAEK